MQDASKNSNASLPAFAALLAIGFVGGIQARQDFAGACVIIADALNNASQDAWTIGMIFWRGKPTWFIWNMSTIITNHRFYYLFPVFP